MEDPGKVNKEMIARRKEIEQDILDYRHKRMEELYAECEARTGHVWWDWHSNVWFDVGGRFHDDEIRSCSVCRKQESRERKPPS